MTSLRPPRKSELHAASRLCLRSKAYWGYDDDFMAACVEELSLSSSDLETSEVVLAKIDDQTCGVAQVRMEEAGCYLEKLFVDPSAMGRGIGRDLFEWAQRTARSLGAGELIIEADPGAAGFYEKLGCRMVGTALSGSISGRELPRLILELGESG